jgi:hypothetical protein
MAALSEAGTDKGQLVFKAYIESAEEMLAKDLKSNKLIGEWV